MLKLCCTMLNAMKQGEYCYFYQQYTLHKFSMLGIYVVFLRQVYVAYQRTELYL